MNTSRRLDHEQLVNRCDPNTLGFETTSELPDLTEPFGQERAVKALEFALGVAGPGYNVYVMGPAGSGRHQATDRVLKSAAARQSPPSDWCYVYNFNEAHKPKFIGLPAGEGPVFRHDMAKLVDELRVALPAAFESESYRHRRAEINREFEERNQKALETIQSAAEREGLGLVQTPQGFVIAPIRGDEVVGPEEFQKLPEEERSRLSSRMENLSKELQRHVSQLPVWQRERHRRIVELDRSVTMTAVGLEIRELLEKYRKRESVVDYLREVELDLVEHAHELRRPDEPVAVIPFLGRPEPELTLRRYQVNVIIDNSETRGLPVVYESNPILTNILGRAEHRAEQGMLTTDFTMIRPGALHRANGGYLILDAERLLIQPFAWSALKRALLDRRLTLESVAGLLGLMSTVSLEPQPIPLDLKVVLIGSRLIYYLLSEFDPDFQELFKIVADFEERVDRSAENVARFARLIATLSRSHGLKPLDRAAVARAVDHAARLAGDGAKIATHLRSLGDLLREADVLARADGGQSIGVEHVSGAIEQQVRRLDREQGLLREAVAKEVLLIATEGAATGQINGLSILERAGVLFGRPVRITAAVRLGEGEVVDIEREVELGGSLHSKGVLILGSFISARYATRLPLSLRATLVFEQSYGPIEGDSASLAESCALLSALAGVELKQSIAVTGSLNQHGQVQAIGGVNEKVEGYFDVCQLRGLDGSHAVIIPRANQQHLMLRADVVEAVRAGRFHVYTVATVDEAMELLTGQTAGARDESRRFPAGSINARVEDRLDRFAAMRREFALPASRARGLRARPERT